jgi:hypothetical protein
MVAQTNTAASRFRVVSMPVAFQPVRAIHAHLRHVRNSSDFSVLDASTPAASKQPGCSLRTLPAGCLEFLEFRPYLLICAQNSPPATSAFGNVFRTPVAGGSLFPPCQHTWSRRQPSEPFTIPDVPPYMLSRAKIRPAHPRATLRRILPPFIRGGQGGQRQCAPLLSKFPKQTPRHTCSPAPRAECFKISEFSPYVLMLRNSSADC